MLGRIYALEHPGTHISSFSPGFVATPMQDFVGSLENDDRFPSIELSKQARYTSLMPSADELACKLSTLIPEFLHQPSGTFISNDTIAPSL
jgi:hypothetical protein